MKKIRGLVSQDTIKKEGPLVVIKAHEKLFKDEEIWGEFCKAVPSQMEEEFEERDMDLNDIFEFILEKSLKSRTGVEIDRFKEANARRNAEKARPGLPNVGRIEEVPRRSLISHFVCVCVCVCVCC